MCRGSAQPAAFPLLLDLHESRAALTAPHVPLQAMNTQSAILLPEPGSIIDAASTDSVWFKGYAWCGGGLPITRVDVSADEGQTWDLADIVERETDFVGQVRALGRVLSLVLCFPGHYGMAQCIFHWVSATRPIGLGY